jgi:hypothetical protein
MAGYAGRSFAAFALSRSMVSTARWKILRKIAPLATGTQDVHHAVHHRTHLGAALAPAGLCRRNERFDTRPFIVRQVARVPQVITIVFRSVLIPPHPWSPPNQITSFEHN